MDLYVVLLIAGAVWFVVVAVAMALCKAAGRAEAEADRAYGSAHARDGEAVRTGGSARTGQAVRTCEAPGRPDRWRPAAL